MYIPDIYQWNEIFLFQVMRIKRFLKALKLFSLCISPHFLLYSY